VALAEADTIRLDDLPGTVRDRKPVDTLTSALSRGLTLDELEREYILRVVRMEGGKQDTGGAALGPGSQDAVSQARGIQRAGRARQRPRQRRSRRRHRGHPGAGAAAGSPLPGDERTPPPTVDETGAAPAAAGVPARGAR